MPVEVGAVYQNTSNVVIIDDAWTSLIGGPKQVVGLTIGPIMTFLDIQGYVLNLSKEDARIRIVVDGTEVAQGSPENPLMYVAPVPTSIPPLSTHTVDFQARALECVETAFAGPVGFVVLDLIPILPPPI